MISHQIFEDQDGSSKRFKNFFKFSVKALRKKSDHSLPMNMLTKSTKGKEVDAENEIDTKLSMAVITSQINENSHREQSDTHKLVCFVEDLEKLQNELSEDLISSQANEISRIGKEFLVNDYERIFKASISDAFSLIVGESNVQKEMSKFSVEKKNHFKTKELCRNYNVFHEKYNEVYKKLFNEKGQ